MARNGSGTYTKVNTFTAGTPITAASHNQNWDDVAAEITNSVAADGQTSMTGPLKASSGTAAAPSHTFASDVDTGIFRRASNELGFSTGGVQAGYVDGSQKLFWGGAVDVTGAFTVNGAAKFPIATADITDKAVTLAKLYHPTAPSRLLGSDSNAALTITGAANNGSGLIRLTVASTSTFATGQQKTVSDVVGTTEANATWTITVVDGTHIDLQGSTFANAYVSGGTIGGAFEEISLGAGLVLTGSSLAAPAFPPKGAFSNLSIKVASNTTVTVVADYVTTTDGTNFQTTALSGTINLGTAGAANALDAGSIATSTWYSIWAIAKADGTTAGLAATSATSPTLPSGYTYKARIGWVRTISASATLLGTWQLGRRAQYVLGLAQTGASYPGAFNSTSSQAQWTAVSLSNFVPTTASETSIIWRASVSSGNIGISANGSASDLTDGLAYINGTIDVMQSVSFVLESSNMYVGTGGGISANRIAVTGWEDNL